MSKGFFNQETFVNQYLVNKVGREYKLQKNFTLGEFQCHDGWDFVLVSPSLIMLLQHLRDYYDRPIYINSGFRSVEHNRAVGGKADSAHLSGMAADITIRGIAPSVVQDYLETLNVGGLGRYDSFTHVDVKGLNRRW